jgi:hypothetical protein
VGTAQTGPPDRLEPFCTGRVVPARIPVTATAAPIDDSAVPKTGTCGPHIANRQGHGHRWRHRKLTPLHRHRCAARRVFHS